MTRVNTQAPSGRMEQEEAALRAKIQAVRNLLQATQRPAHHTSMGYRQSHQRTMFRTPYAPYHARKPTVSVNKTWTRTCSASSAPRPTPTTSANKVWVNEKVARPSKPVVSMESGGGHTTQFDEVCAMKTQPPVAGDTSFAKRVRNQLQTQVLQLEDGEYAKASGGFSLVRSDVIKAKTTAPVPKSAPRHPVSLTPVATSIAARAQLAVNRARAMTRGKTRAAVRVRTEYCRFFNKFGYCSNETKCKFIHDSRRVALCRKFLKGKCDDSQCLLSHDKNKMPVCTLFLRGACTRDDCRFRHVKVSGTADICEAFLKGYCPAGATCTMKHELPSSKKSPGDPRAEPTNGRSLVPSTRTTSGTSLSGGTAAEKRSAPTVCSSSKSDTSSTPGGEVEREDAPTSTVVSELPLSIRPNIRFTPRHQNILSPILSLKKKTA